MAFLKVDIMTKLDYSIKPTKIHILEPYEEVVGELNGISFSEGSLIAQVGRISIVLPLNMGSQVRPHIGQRISILRTDLPEKQFLVRTITCDTVSEAKS
jgi:hypothetical protein